MKNNISVADPKMRQGAQVYPFLPILIERKNSMASIHPESASKIYNLMSTFYKTNKDIGVSVK